MKKGEKINTISKDEVTLKKLTPRVDEIYAQMTAKKGEKKKPRRWWIVIDISGKAIEPFEKLADAQRAIKEEGRYEGFYTYKVIRVEEVRKK